MATPHAVITDSEAIDASTTRISRDLAYEIAAVSAAILDAREEKTNTAKRLNLRIRELEKRQRELIDQIRTGGTQLAINFGSKVVEILDEIDEEGDHVEPGDDTDA